MYDSISFFDTTKCLSSAVSSLSLSFTFPFHSCLLGQDVPCSSLSLSLSQAFFFWLGHFNTCCTCYTRSLIALDGVGRSLPFVFFFLFSHQFAL